MADPDNLDHDLYEDVDESEHLEIVPAGFQPKEEEEDK